MYDAIEDQLADDAAATRAQDLVAEVEKRFSKQTACKACSLPPTEREVVATLRKRGTVSSAGIAQWLNERGHKIGETSLRRHFKGCAHD